MQSKLLILLVAQASAAGLRALQFGYTELVPE